jgi:hypothetical protein
MRPAAGRRFPAVLIVLLALIGVAVSVAIGRGIAARADENSTNTRAAIARTAQHDAIDPSDPKDLRIFP